MLGSLELAGSDVIALWQEFSLRDILERLAERLGQFGVAQDVQSLLYGREFFGTHEDKRRPAVASIASSLSGLIAESVKITLAEV